MSVHALYRNWLTAVSPGVRSESHTIARELGSGFNHYTVFIAAEDCSASLAPPRESNYGMSS